MSSSSSAADTPPTLDEPFHNDHFDRLPHAPCVSLYHRLGREGCGTYDRSTTTGRLVRWDLVVEGGGGGDGNDAERRRQEELHARPEEAEADGGRGRRRAEGGGGSTGAIPPYVAVMDEADYGSENVARLLSFSSSSVAGDHYGGDGTELGGPLRGLLVLTTADSESSSSSSSPSSPAPRSHDGTVQESLTVGPSYGWNSYGDGLATTDLYGLPTVYVSDGDSASYLRRVAEEQSASGVDADAHPAVVSEFNYYMGGASEGEDETGTVTTLTAKECLEWKDTSDGEWRPKCQPLGGNSVWAAAGTPVSFSGGGEGEDDGDDQRSAVMLAASIDDTSMFHDISPGANGAASNVLALLVAARLVGTISDDVLDGLKRRITFGFFQGESYGYVGSRSFLSDVVSGFECENGGDEGVPAKSSEDADDDGRRACLSPLRHDLSFQGLSGIDGMIAVDRVADLGGGKTLYVQGGENTAPNDEEGLAAFLAEVLVALSPDNGDDGGNDDGYLIQASSVEASDDDDGAYPLPPAVPLNSLVKISGGAAGGVVLTGYDDAFVGPYYRSHLDSKLSRELDLDAVAAAGTVLARAAVAAAYYGGEDDGDDDAAATASAADYALGVLPDPASASDEYFQVLTSCLYEDGNCDLFLAHGNVERKNDAAQTGADLGLGQPLGTPPSYYANVYNGDNGQAFVLAGGRYYGNFVGGADPLTEESEEELKEYGTNENDAFFLRPSLLEMSIHGLLNEYLGKGSLVSADDGTAPELKACESTNDCSGVSYCSGGGDEGEGSAAACAGRLCVCGSRAHYHPALDEGFRPAENYGTGRFEVVDEGGISAMYTEPNWSSSVGVRIYRDAGKGAGAYALGFGLAYFAFCVVAVRRIRGRLAKEKVY